MIKKFIVIIKHCKNFTHIVVCVLCSYELELLPPLLHDFVVVKLACYQLTGDSSRYTETIIVMEQLFAALKTGSVENVRKVFEETTVSTTVRNEVRYIIIIIMRKRIKVVLYT